jgi:hypothetical protein
MALWEPDQLSSLVIWLDFDDASTITSSGGEIQQIDDKSGNGNHAVQNQASYRPDETTAINGLGTANFEVDRASLQIPNAASWKSSAVSCATVARNNEVGSSKYLHAATNPSTLRSWLFFGSSSNISIFAYNSAGTTKLVSASGSWGNGDERLLLWTAANSDVLQFWVDGTSKGSTTSETWRFDTTTSNMGIGNHSHGHPFESKADVGEFLYFSEQLSDSDRELVEGYLAHKWGLEGQLPSDHPYKSEAPTTGNDAIEASLTETDTVTAVGTAKKGASASLSESDSVSGVVTGKGSLQSLLSESDSLTGVLKGTGDLVSITVGTEILSGTLTATGVEEPRRRRGRYVPIWPTDIDLAEEKKKERTKLSKKAKRRLRKQIKRVTQAMGELVQPLVDEFDAALGKASEAELETLLDVASEIEQELEQKEVFLQELVEELYNHQEADRQVKRLSEAVALLDSIQEEIRLEQERIITLVDEEAFAVVAWAVSNLS